MLWDRKRFKQKAKKAFVKNYIYAVAVCFLIAFIASEGSTSLKLVKKYDATKQSAANTVNQIKMYSNSSAIKDWIGDIDFLNIQAGTKIEDVYVSVIEELVSDNDLLLRTYESNKSFVMDNQILISLCIAMGSIVLLLFRIFIGNVLIVGKRRFFMENRIEKDYKTPIGTILYSFKSELYLKTVKIMFLKGLYTLLWSLTIIGGFIKYYEYRSIPFIVASNSQLTTKEIFGLSKSMMKGYKWKTFVLDLSFVLWKILQSLTLGLAGIFYVLPYMAATRTESYIAIRNEAIAMKKPYYECLKNPLFHESVEEYL